MPPTERKGRVHTSTVTVVALEELPESNWVIRDSDLHVFTTKDSGPGGQHRNKTESCVIIRHLPTGIEAKAASKSQHANKKTARAMIEARVKDHYDSIKKQEESKIKKEKAGSGMRGDKVRTYREQDDIASDHLRNNKCRLRDVKRGLLEKLF